MVPRIILIKKLKKTMKKLYLAPISEEIKIKQVSILSASPDPDTTDPVPVIPEPDDDDLDW